MARYNCICNKFSTDEHTKIMKHKQDCTEWTKWTDAIASDDKIIEQIKSQGYRVVAKALDMDDGTLRSAIRRNPLNRKKLPFIPRGSPMEQKRKRENAKKMILDGKYSFPEITEITGIGINTINRIRKELGLTRKYHYNTDISAAKSEEPPEPESPVTSPLPETPPQPPRAAAIQPPQPPRAEDKIKALEQYIEALENLTSGFRELVREKEEYKRQAESWRRQTLEIKAKMDQLAQGFDRKL